jgi:hypothetical protein
MVCLCLFYNLFPARCSYEFALAIRTLLVRCSYAARTSSRTLFARCSYAARTSANSPANRELRDAPVCCPEFRPSWLSSYSQKIREVYDEFRVIYPIKVPSSTENASSKSRAMSRQRRRALPGARMPSKVSPENLAPRVFRSLAWTLRQ